MKILSFHNENTIEKKLNFIDLASVEYISKKKAKNYQPKPDYKCILPKTIRCKGYYFIKLLDKPKSIHQFLKKGNIYKFDKEFILKHMPNINIKDLNNLGDKVSIVNILPIYEYTTPPFLKKERNRLIKRVK